MRKRSQGQPQRPVVELSEAPHEPVLSEQSASVPAVVDEVDEMVAGIGSSVQAESLVPATTRTVSTAADSAAKREPAQTVVSVNPFWSEKTQLEAQLRATRPVDLPQLDDAQTMVQPTSAPTSFGPGGTETLVVSDPHLEVRAEQPSKLELAEKLSCKQIAGDDARDVSASSEQDMFGMFRLLQQQTAEMISSQITNQNRQISNLVAFTQQRNDERADQTAKLIGEQRHHTEQLIGEQQELLQTTVSALTDRLARLEETASADHVSMQSAHSHVVTPNTTHVLGGTASGLEGGQNTYPESLLATPSLETTGQVWNVPLTAPTLNACGFALDGGVDGGHNQTSSVALGNGMPVGTSVSHDAIPQQAVSSTSVDGTLQQSTNLPSSDPMQVYYILYTIYYTILRESY